ncbi:hypothetical protein [Shewanella sp.]|uniref:hypothetical protein n=1 Tax=Shewanella sp. TaxID=50422 RepID=UPI001EB9B81A|nr:hypothetical protein [Shewanella sp.]NRB26008.1 hypothetical protein [Shewanella sp.]
MKRIGFFLKIFENEKYMNDFLDGKIYMNRISYFRGIEGDQEDNRADSKEALCALWQTNDVVVEVNGRKITDFAAPIESVQHHSKYLHLFCLFAGAISESNFLNPHANISDIQNDLSVPEKCAVLGEHYVVIHNAQKFIDRMVETVKKKGYGNNAQAGMVEYYDFETFTGEFGNRSAFFKRDQFLHQKEYRFVIDTETEGTEPLVLDIGDIRDIASVSDTWNVKVNIQTQQSEKIV